MDEPNDKPAPDRSGIHYLLELGPYTVTLAREKLNADPAGRALWEECKTKYADDYPETIVSLTATALALESRLAVMQKEFTEYKRRAKPTKLIAAENPFCAACKESDCLVSLDGSCAFIREYNAQKNAGYLNHAWALINSNIKTGPLPGNGNDETAERNGMITAANWIAEEIRRLENEAKEATPCSTS